MKLILVFLSALLLTSCAGGGVSSQNENSFISGSGIATFVEKADRKIAPILSGETLTSGKITLNKNQVTVINVWASWCAPCRAEAPVLQEFSVNYPDVQFAGILTRDNPATAEAFSRRLAMPYPTFIDDSLLIGFKGTLPANAIPSTVLIDKRGNVAARISGEVTLNSLSKLIRKLEAE